jgi:hypothetical protein
MKYSRLSRIEVFNDRKHGEKLFPPYMGITYTSNENNNELLREFFDELFIKVNKKFKNTKAEIDYPENNPSQYEMNALGILQRSAIIQTIHDDKILQSANIQPATPKKVKEFRDYIQSYNVVHSWDETVDISITHFISQFKNNEDIAYLLSHANTHKSNLATQLFLDIKKQKEKLGFQNKGLTNEDLKSDLIILNSGLKLSENEYGVRPTILPGITEAFPSSIFKQAYELSITSKDSLPNVSYIGLFDSEGLPIELDSKPIHSKQEKFILPKNIGNLELAVLTRSGTGDIYLKENLNEYLKTKTIYFHQKN